MMWWRSDPGALCSFMEWMAAPKARPPWAPSAFLEYQGGDTELNTRSLTYEEWWTPLFFTDYPVILFFFSLKLRFRWETLGKALCSQKCCHKYLNIYVTFEYFSNIYISIAGMGKWVYTQKSRILNVMSTSRTSTVTTSPHFCSALKPHRLLPRKWTGASPFFSLHKPDRIAALRTSFCPSKLSFRDWAGISRDETTGRINKPGLE